MARITCTFSEEVTARRFYADMLATGRGPSEPIQSSDSGKWIVKVFAAIYIFGV